MAIGFQRTLEIMPAARDLFAAIVNYPLTPTVDAPSDSGKGQKISHCPKCHIAVWSKHAESPVWFVHVGTLDEPDRLAPDIHVFAASKQPWISLPPETRAFAEFYNPSEVWPKESLQRRAEMLARLEQR
jgi:hypothetical protein